MSEATANLSNPGASATSLTGTGAAAAPAPPAAAAPPPTWLIGAAILASLLWLFSRKG